MGDALADGVGEGAGVGFVPVPPKVLVYDFPLIVIVKLPPVVAGGTGKVPTREIETVWPFGPTYEPVKLIVPVAGSNVPDKKGVAITKRLLAVVLRDGSTISSVPEAVLLAATVRFTLPV